MASKESIDGFLEILEVNNLKDINLYKKELKKELSKIYPNPEYDPNKGDENWENIILGLSIIRIQERYHEADPSFDELLVKKQDFDQYMKQACVSVDNQSIVGYLVELACDVYGDIVLHSDFTDIQIQILKRIHLNTLKWLEKIGKCVNGQYQIVNTLCSDEICVYDEFARKSGFERLIKLAECKISLCDFLKYLWKIMFNLAQEKVFDDSDIKKYVYVFDPTYYMDSSISEYICLNFPDDESSTHTVILPKAGSCLNSDKRKIISRMINVNQKPEKWYFDNSAMIAGKNYYNYYTRNVIEKSSIVNLGDDSFYIECMKCIGIDEGDWEKTEKCSDCIFSLDCVKDVKRSYLYKEIVLEIVFITIIFVMSRSH